MWALAGTTVAKSGDVIVAVDVLAPGQLRNQGFVERGDRQEIEGVQALDAGKAGRLCLMTTVRNECSVRQ